MSKNVAESISKDVKSLLDILARKSTREIVMSCLLFNLRRVNDLSQDEGLLAPAKQITFLLGLMASTAEPENPSEFTKEEWRECLRLLQDVYNSYQELWWPSPEEASALTEEWARTREVAMLAFDQYFNADLLASSDQVAAMIRAYHEPFDEALGSSLGIGATKSLEIADWCARRLEDNSEQLHQAFKVEKAARLDLLKRASSLDELRHLAATGGHKDLLQRLFDAMEGFGVIIRSDLVAAFPSEGQQYWDAYSLTRGDGPPLLYPTDRSIAELRPLIRLDNEGALCPTVNALFTSIYKRAEGALSAGPSRTAFSRRRDTTLESQTTAQFRRLLGPKPRFLEHCFETEGAQGEHDLIVIDNDWVIFVEDKASPPREPLRDPAKAFTRIRDSFRSDVGIQTAFEQAATIARRLAAGQVVPLYDAKGELIHTLDPALVERRYCVCVTRDNFGAIATNLSLLLEKEAGDAFPWATNIVDLEALADAWQYLKWGPERFLQYLAERRQIHGKVFGVDELEFAGFFIAHGTLKHAKDVKADLVVLNPRYSDFFDNLYHHQRYGLPGPKPGTKEPAFVDFRKALPASMSGEKQNPGRNDPCPCGSGKKYKKCHGK